MEVEFGSELDILVVVRLLDQTVDVGRRVVTTGGQLQEKASGLTHWSRTG